MFEAEFECVQRFREHVHATEGWDSPKEVERALGGGRRQEQAGSESSAGSKCVPQPHGAPRNAGCVFVIDRRHFGAGRRAGVISAGGTRVAVGLVMLT